MAHFSRLCGATALATVLATSPAFADLTAQDVWADWRSYIGGLGYDISASEAVNGDTLTITNLMMKVAIPEDGGTVTMTLGEVSLRDNGDGTVAITMPASTPFIVNARPEGEEQVDVQVNINQTGLNMVASGSPKDLSYSYTAAKFGMALASLVVDGKSMDGVATFEMLMENMIGRSQMQLGDLRFVAQKFSVDSISYLVTAADPKGEGNLKFNGGAKNMSFEGEATIPLDIDPTKPEDIFAKGFSVSGSYQVGATSSEFYFIDRGEAVQMSSSSSSGQLGMTMNSERVEYALGSKDLKIDMAGGDIPFPISASTSELGFALKMPVAASDQPQDFGFAFSLVDFAVPDMLWSIADPQNVLPRGPATMVVDLNGTAKLMSNLLDPKVIESSAPPGELHSLNLDGLRVSVAGTELTGNGAFTFDNTDLQSFDGLPKPTGTVQVKLVGGNGLLDNLVKMGLVPENEAMQARMMMGLFAVPGDGPDTLNSTLEVNDQGHVLANGQRIK